MSGFPNAVFEALSSPVARVVAVCAALGALASPAHAIGPTNQLLTTPYVFNNADPQNLPKLRTNSIVQIDTSDGTGFENGTRGTGAVIQSRIINSVGYFCVLTADHNLNGTTTSTDFISFNNSAAEDESSQPRFSVVSYARVPGDQGETVDMAVAVVRIGDPNQTLYTQTLDEDIALISVGGGRRCTEIGFGRRTGQNDDATTDPLVGVANTYGFKRYQNQMTTRTINNFARTYLDEDYAYHALTYTFDAIGAVNRVAGEGFGFSGDSGAPLLIDAEVDSTNLNGQNNSIFTNFIAGVEAFGGNDTSDDPDDVGPLGVGEGATVDAGYYNAKISTTCDTLLTALAPTPTPSATATPTLTPTPTPTETPTVDHFTCYKAGATSGSVKFLGIPNPPGIWLIDQFGPEQVEVKKPKFLCAPTDKNGEDPSAPTHPEHLKAYQIKYPMKPVLPTNIKVVDQFNPSGLFVGAKKPSHLLVPSMKSFSMTPPTPPAFVTDHFECYKVAVSKNTPKFTPVSALPIGDQFGAMTVDVKKPAFLCNPVDKNGEDPTAPAHVSHLMCYKVKQVDAVKFTKVTGVFVNNQFGPETLDVKKPALLCLPATTP